ncbi:MAG: fatty acid/phospholipid synthesis protein PlsX [Deltaproteobacteria bacterium]|nr:fatty acid/phospholipid synthesis protein PlsX [Deltaproteobacteria bacterium]
MKIAVDAMGGDHAPREVVRGAIQAFREHGFPVILVGQEDRIRQELAAVDSSGADIEIVHASEVVEMCELPGIALKKKKDSSIRVGISLVAEGKAHSFVSAGNSGAVMGGGLLILKKIQGIDRPAIAAAIPTPHGPVVLIDAGANVDCKPAHLVQFAFMGEAYARKFLGISDPRVAVVSIGEEDSKGTDLTRETCELLRQTGLRFVGNAEGRDFFSGKADVFVCDGFVGNVVVKTMEGLAMAFGPFLKAEIDKSILAKAGLLLARGALRNFKKRLDYAETGGWPLLGVRGGVMICHGSSDQKAIKNAIRAAGSMASFGLDEEIARSIGAGGHART